MLAKRKIGNLEVSALGVGCMSLSEFYNTPDIESARNVLRKAIDLGMTHFDTADMYGYGKNEELVAEIVGPVKAKNPHITIATKCGIVRSKTDPHARGIRNDPAYIEECLEMSLERLKVDCIDLYYLHRIERETPIEESVGALARHVKAGKIKHIGLSEASVEILKRAHAVHPITALQSEYSLATRNVEHNNILQTCKELGIGFVAYSPLGRGLLAGKVRAVSDLGEGDFRRLLPRMSNENFASNMNFVQAIEQMAAEKSCTATQLALAWVLAQGEFIVPIPGTTRIERLVENIGALDVKLSAQDLQRINDICQDIPIAGTRIAAEAIKAYNMPE